MTVPERVMRMIEKTQDQRLNTMKVTMYPFVRLRLEQRPKTPLRKKNPPHQIPYAES